MAKPVVLTVDDDPEVLRAVERDLRRKYGQEYRVLRADSGANALDACKQRNEAVALFLVDQRMPSMSGVQFLEQAIPLYPNAKRVLLTAYADTDAAIQAINTVKIQHYLLKPWDPPEERLCPVLDDLLEEWRLGRPGRDVLLDDRAQRDDARPRRLAARRHPLPGAAADLAAASRARNGRMMHDRDISPYGMLFAWLPTS